MEAFAKKNPKSLFKAMDDYLRDLNADISIMSRSVVKVPDNVPEFSTIPGPIDKHLSETHSEVHDIVIHNARNDDLKNEKEVGYDDGLKTEVIEEGEEVFI